MVKFYTSYFYQIRFFKPNMIPISTAIWDPKWFSDFKGQGHIFKDKNGVYNGIRSKLLQPQMSTGDEGECGGQKDGVCVKHGTDVNHTNCQFLKKYEEQLDNINFERFKADLLEYAYKLKYKESWEEDPIIVFIVYETPNNPCSERKVIQNLFNQHNVPCEELKYPIKDNY